MLIAKLVCDLTCIVVDIESAFLHRDLDEEVYMEVPKGLKIGDNKRLFLRKTFYGILQSARKVYEKLINVLKIIGTNVRKTDPCLWTI
jgi:hypothetical protein